MARFKLSFSTKDRQKKGVETDSIGPSAEWVAKNRHTKRFQNIISRSWKTYFSKINIAYKKQYKVGAAAATVYYFDDVMAQRVKFEKRGTYTRADKLPNKKGLGHKSSKVKTSSKGDKLMLSKELYNTVGKCQLAFDDTLSEFGYSILTPSNKSDYIALDMKVNKNTNGRNYYLSEMFEDSKHGFNFRHTGLPLGFEIGGAHYNIAQNRMMKALKAEEQKQKTKK